MKNYTNARFSYREILEIMEENGYTFEDSFRQRLYYLAKKKHAKSDKNTKK